MPCAPLVDPRCVQPVDNDDHPFAPPMPDIPAAIGGGALEGAAKALQEGVGWFVSRTSSWWAGTASPDLEKESAIGFLAGVTRPVTVFVAVLAMFVVAARMVLVRKANPLVDAGSGLTMVAIVSVVGAAVPNALLQWGDGWSAWVLKASADEGFSARMTKIVTLPSGVPAGVVLILSLIALFVGVIQAILMLFRQGALIVLTGLLPLAAAGMITAATWPWFKKVASWMLALTFYKPLAAAVYATAFTLIGHGTDLRSILLGHTMLLVSLVAFPVLLKLFSWTTSAADSGAGGTILGALIGGATAMGALRSYGGAAGSGGRVSSANEHAAYLDQQLASHRGRQNEQSHQPSSPVPGPNTSAEGSGAPSAPAGGASAPAAAPDGSTTDVPRAPTGGVGASDGHHAGGAASPGGGSDEPVGPVAVDTWNNERQRARNMIRWMGNPTGSSDAGGAPTGSGGAGGGGGG